MAQSYLHLLSGIKKPRKDPPPAESTASEDDLVEEITKESLIKPVAELFDDLKPWLSELRARHTFTQKSDREWLSSWVHLPANNVCDPKYQFHSRLIFL